MDSAIMAANEKMKVVVSDDVEDDNYWKRVMARMDERGRIIYAHDEGFSEGIEQGMAQGMEKGLEQRSTEFARKMKARGRPLDEIIEDTGLSPEEIEKL